VKNVQRPSSADRPRSRSLSFIRALRPPPDALETRAERMLAMVAIALVVWMLADIVLKGL
jgi:hypothetical protein